MGQEISSLAFVLSILVMFMMMAAMMYLTMKLIQVASTYSLKSKIKKIKMDEYIVLDCYRGVPRTLQNKKDLNKIIYL